MYRILNENSTFRELDIPLRPARRRELEKRIKKSAPIDPIPVWDGQILAGYEKYELCIKYRRKYLCSEMRFTRKHDAVAWACREQLKRPDLCHAAKAWLHSRLYTALRDAENLKTARDQFMYKMLSPSYRSEEYCSRPRENTDLMRQIAGEYGCCWRTIQYHIHIGRQLDRLEEWFPGTRIRILKGETAIVIKHIDMLMRMPMEALARMINDPECRVLDPPPEMLEEVRQGRENRNTDSIRVETAIKEVPPYDPDAELNGLTFTIGAWVKAMNRAGEKADFSHATQDGRERLRCALAALKQETGSLERMLEVEEDE